MISMRLVTRGYKIFALDYTPFISLNKISSNINSGWRSIADKNKMAEDFQILIDGFHKKYIGYWWSKDIKSLDFFIKNSKAKISSPFEVLELSDINESSIDTVKKRIDEIFSTMDFNSSISYMIESCMNSSDG